MWPACQDGWHWVQWASGHTSVDAESQRESAPYQVLSSFPTRLCEICTAAFSVCNIVMDCGLATPSPWLAGCHRLRRGRCRPSGSARGNRYKQNSAGKKEYATVGHDSRDVRIDAVQSEEDYLAAAGLEPRLNAGKHVIDGVASAESPRLLQQHSTRSSAKLCLHRL